MNCEPIVFGTVPPRDELAEGLKRDLTNAILWADGNSARSRQVTLGPSELGAACDRKVAYGLANTPSINAFTDPWPAIVGTSIHAWLEKALASYQQYHQMDRWLTELTVQPDPLVTGHLDLYDRAVRAVVDWKTLGVQKMREWKKTGPPEKYINQVQLYGKGAILKGLPVEKVILIGIPRAGLLSDMTICDYDYDEGMAQTALDRMYSIARKVIEIGADTNDLRMEQIEAQPERGDCQWCPWYDMKGWGAGCSGNK